MAIEQFAPPTQLIELQPQTQQNLDSMRTSAMNRMRAFTVEYAVHAATSVALLAGGAGVVLAVEGFSPHPAVSAAGSEALIHLTDGLRAGGAAAVVGGAIAGSAIYLRRKHDQSLEDAAASTEASPLARLAGVGLTAILVASGAAATSIGDAAAKGATLPVRILAEAVSPGSPENVFFVKQSKDVLPFNHSEVTQLGSNSFALGVARAGGTTIPYSLLLGHVARENNDATAPSSTPIVVMPNNVIKRQFGVNLVPAPQKKDVDCKNINVIANKQLGADPTTVVTIENQKAHVAATIDAYPGLDRAIVIAPLETFKNCITLSGLYSGLAVSGLAANQVNDIAKSTDFPYVIESADAFTRRYEAFWDKSVKPPEMQLLGLIALTSIAGLSFMKITDVLMREPLIAELYSEGASHGKFAKAELLRAIIETVKASYYAAPLALGFIAINNSSQYGVAEVHDLTSLGAGFLIGAGANAVAAAAAIVYVARTDKSAAER